MITKDQIIQSITKFNKLKVLVVGDLFLDEYIETEMQEISREGPFPVLVYRSMTQLAGAAGNLASSISGLGAKVSIACVVGDDARGKILKEQLTQKGIQNSACLTDPDHPTLTYSKIRSRVENSPSQEIFRIDVLPQRMLPAKIEEELIKKIDRQLDRVQGVILLDQIHQLVAGKLLREIPKLARKKKVFIQGSSRDYIRDFKGFDLITPNDREASEALMGKVKGIKKIGEAIKKHGRHKKVLLTLGSDGMALFESRRPMSRIPTFATEVVDVTGAGDSVSSVALLGSLSGWDFETVAKISSIAAATVISKVGTHHLGAEELIGAVKRSNLV